MNELTPTAETAPAANEAAPTSSGSASSHGHLTAAWNTVCAAVGAVMGLLPHVLHHIGIFAGAALVTGAAGNLAFGALGLLLSTPMLLRLYRRFHSWKAPALAVAIFAAMFALSAFVLGPAVTGTNDQPNTRPVPTKAADPLEHAAHHSG